MYGFILTWNRRLFLKEIKFHARLFNIGTFSFLWCICVKIICLNGRVLRLEFSHGVYEHLALDNRAGGCVGFIWGTRKNFRPNG